MSKMSLTVQDGEGSYIDQPSSLAGTDMPAVSTRCIRKAGVRT